MFDRRRFLVAGASLGLAAVAACSSDDDRPDSDSPSVTGSNRTTEAIDSPSPTGANDPYVPGAGAWETVDPASVGWSPEALDELATFLEGERSRTFVLLVGGRIAAEHYWAGATVDVAEEIASCQKSVVSTLCGIAVDRDLLTVDDPVTDHLGPGWTNAAAAAERAITVRHLLSMTSGLDEGTLTEAVPPGTVWAYNTSAYQKLRPVLEAVAGTDIESLTRDWLWDPIGVSAASRWRERQGDGPLQVDATGDRLWSLEMTARDLARFGLLVQRYGSWGTAQVVSSAWFGDALAPSQDLNPAYGYLWWLGGAIGGRHRPDDLVAALGAFDQKVFVSTSADFALVRQGGTANETSATTSSFDAEILDRLLAAR